MYFSFYTVFIVLRAAVRALVGLAVLLGFTCLVAFVYFVYFYEQINDDDDDDSVERWHKATDETIRFWWQSKSGYGFRFLAECLYEFNLHARLPGNQLKHYSRQSTSRLQVI